MRKLSILNLLVQFFVSFVFGIGLLFLPPVAPEPEIIKGCIPSGFLQLQVPKPPAMDYSLILGQTIEGIKAPGAVLYAVPLQESRPLSNSQQLPANRITDISGQVLWQRLGNTARPTASMTKLMSLLLVQEHLQGRDLNELRAVPYGGAAAQRPFDAAVAGLKQGQVFSWAQLLSYVIIASANDAIYTLAIWVGQEQIAEQNLDKNKRTESPPIVELAESEQSESASLEYFVRRMNERASELGLRSARFVDPDGWSTQDVISPLDMARLAAWYTARFPEFIDWFRQSHVNLGHKTKTNTNLLLPYYPEVEGLKTGFTYEAGFNFTAVARRGNWRYIAVVMGIEESHVRKGLLRRAAEAEVLLNWGLKNFVPLDIAPLQILSVQPSKPSRVSKLSVFASMLNAKTYSNIYHRYHRVLATIPSSLGAYLLPVHNNSDMFLERPIRYPKRSPKGSRGPGLLQNEELPKTVKQQNILFKENLVWRFHWQDGYEGPSYGEIWLYSRPLVRFVLPEKKIQDKSYPYIVARWLFPNWSMSWNITAKQTSTPP